MVIYDGELEKWNLSLNAGSSITLRRVEKFLPALCPSENNVGSIAGGREEG